MHFWQRNFRSNLETKTSPLPWMSCLEGLLAYITECLVGFSQGQPLNVYSINLESRILAILKKVATDRSLSLYELCKEWLDQITSLIGDPWIFVRDARLCGRQPPRGIIFSILLNLLFLRSHQTSLNDQIVTLLAISFTNWGKLSCGLEGYLLEMIEILKLKNENGLNVVRLSKCGVNWTRNKEETFPFPFPKEAKCECEWYGFSEDKVT